MTRAAVIGNPIGHSLSPRIFSFLSQKLSIKNFSYDAIQVPESELAQFMGKARSEFVGLNVTIPHKVEIQKFLDVLSGEARAVGAVNCVRFSQNPKGISAAGFNTDVAGFSETLVEHRVSVRGRKVMILGCGGAARAVAQTLGSQQTSEVCVWGRDVSKAERFCEDFSVKFPKTKWVPLQQFPESSVSLVVNATPVGMKGKGSEGSEIFEKIFSAWTSQGFSSQSSTEQASSSKTSSLQASCVAIDLIYRPLKTPFLRVAESHGCRVLDGLDMLIYQALASWEIWFGKLSCDRQTLKNSLREYLLEVLQGTHLFLTGFMGAGKSTIGPMLAKNLGVKFIDLDQEIERDVKMTISEYFQKFGEPAFRNTESLILQKMLGSDGLVISLGGGTLLNPDNLKKIQKSGKLVYLKASARTLSRRLADFEKSRPLLSRAPQVTLENHIQKLLSLREAQYEKADYILNTDACTPEEAAITIEKWALAQKGRDS